MLKAPSRDSSEILFMNLAFPILVTNPYRLWALDLHEQARKAQATFRDGQ
jgi:hypothetical protein